MSRAENTITQIAQGLPSKVCLCSESYALQFTLWQSFKLRIPEREDIADSQACFPDT